MAVLWVGNGAAAEEGVRPPQETVRVVYRLYYSGVPVGEVTEVWTRTGDAYGIVSSAQPYAVLQWLAPSFQETSRGSVEGHDLRPTHFEHWRNDASQSYMADFDWDTDVLEHHFDGKVESVPLLPGTQDMLSIKYLYRVAGEAMLGRDIPMTTGKKLEVHHLVAQEKSETVTDAGRFKTLHVVDGGQKAPSRFELWLPEDRRYPPVRMQVTERGHQWEQRMLRVEIE
ncbi:MAG: DUF3108 domain-containing protein [Burkholderiales bacterium]